MRTFYTKELKDLIVQLSKENSLDHEKLRHVDAYLLKWLFFTLFTSALLFFPANHYYGVLVGLAFSLLVFVVLYFTSFSTHRNMVCNRYAVLSTVGEKVEGEITEVFKTDTRYIHRGWLLKYRSNQLYANKIHSFEVPKIFLKEVPVAGKSTILIYQENKEIHLPFFQSIYDQFNLRREKHA